MKKKGSAVITIITIFCSLFIIAIFLYFLWENNKLRKENVFLNQKCEELNKQIESFKQNLTNQQTIPQEYLDYITSLEKEVDELRQKLKQQQNVKKTIDEKEVNKLLAELKDKEKLITDKEKLLSAKEELLKKKEKELELKEKELKDYEDKVKKLLE
jgi:flagellar basal body-associated protein FliL